MHQFYMANTCKYHLNYSVLTIGNSPTGAGFRPWTSATIHTCVSFGNAAHIEPGTAHHMIDPKDNDHLKQSKPNELNPMP